MGDRVSIEVPQGATAAALDQALAAAATVFGVELALPALVLPRAAGSGQVPAERLLEQTTALCCRLAADAPAAPGQGFALRVRRRDKSFPVGSQTIADSVGRAILERNLLGPGGPFRSGLHHLHRAPRGSDLRLDPAGPRAPGGLPVGIAGRLVALLSGGFDSPVAAWMMASRGASLDFVYLAPLRADPEEAATRKAVRLARALSRYTGRSRLVLVPTTHFDLCLTGPRTGYEALLFRRFAFRCGEAVARRFGAGALITGDSLSQVASQTLENLISVDAAVSLPVLRPLGGARQEGDHAAAPNRSGPGRSPRFRRRTAAP